MLATPTSLSSKSINNALGDEFQEEMEDGEEVFSTAMYLHLNLNLKNCLQRKADDKSKMSKRKLKKLTRLSVAELKQLVNRPDVVEMHDVTARDPKLLVQLSTS